MTSLLSRGFIAFSLVAGSGMALVVTAPTVSAAACSLPATDHGSVTFDVVKDDNGNVIKDNRINIPTTATYKIWVRMKAPSTTQNTFDLQVDTTSCFSVGGGPLVAASWKDDTSNWVSYQGGAPSNTIAMSLAAGKHTLKLIGTQPGVEVDRVIITSDTSCTPSGIGANCEAGDATNPTVGLQVLAGGQAVTNGQTVGGQLTMNSTATDASGIANVQFLVDGTAVNTDSTSPYSFSWNSATVANGSHAIAARATDTKNNVATTGTFNVNITNATPCTGNPTIPANFRVTGASVNSVSLAWNASTPATACNLQGYRIFRNGIQVATPAGTTYTDVGLTSGMTYSYAVEAIDTGNHVSGKSGAINGATTADAEAPTIPTKFHSTLIATSSVALAWDASTDNAGVKDYVVYRNGTQVGASATASFTDAALAPNTIYSFTVRARDYANNMSAASQALSVKTLAGTNANKGDLNGDNKVTLTDLSILLSHWGQTSVPISQGDVNGNGKVDLTDLSMLLSNWGKAL